MSFTINILVRDYSEIELISENETIVIPNLYTNKFYGYFHGDKIDFDIESYTILKLVKREVNTIDGIIDFFGKYQFPPSKRKIPGYLFIPIHKHLPKFIVYSNEKKKMNKNQLACIEYKCWTHEIPIGMVKKIYGNFDSIKTMESVLLSIYDIIPKKKNFTIKLC